MLMRLILLVVAARPRQRHCWQRRKAAGQPPFRLVFLLDDASYCSRLMPALAGARGGQHCRTRSMAALPSSCSPSTSANRKGSVFFPLIVPLLISRNHSSRQTTLCHCSFIVEAMPSARATPRIPRFWCEPGRHQKSRPQI